MPLFNYINPLLLAESLTWGEFLLKKVGPQPQNYMGWLIVFLLALVALAFTRNKLEESSTQRAMVIARGIVGTFIAFVVTPVVIFILLNIIALVHGVNTIDIGFLAKWIGLTLSSYWWLLKCAFGSESLSGADAMYSVDSMVRILWIVIPFSVVWFRMSKTRIGKLFLIPLIIGTFLLARYKKAPPTFITEDMELIQKVPILNMFINDPDAPYQEATLNIERRKIIAGGLLLFLFAGFVVGLYLKKYVIGIFLAMVGILGFLLMAPHEQERIIPKSQHEHYHADIDSLINKMAYLHHINPDTIEVYNLSLRIDAAFHARMDMGDNIVFPDSLCQNYESYFYDWCKSKQE